MSCIHFIGGEKGGIGKSVLCRLLAQYFIDHEISFSAYDSDKSHGAMLRFYPEYTKPVVLEDFEQFDQLFEEAMNENKQILVDLAAQTAQSLYHWLDTGSVLEITNELGMNMKFWHVMDDGYDCLNLLTQNLDKFQKKMPDFIVVKNYGRGENFSALHWSGIPIKLHSLNIPILELPGLHTGTMRKIDHNGSSFWAAINNKNKSIGPCLSILERERAKHWIKSVYSKLDALNTQADFTGKSTLSTS